MSDDVGFSGVRFGKCWIIVCGYSVDNLKKMVGSRYGAKCTSCYTLKYASKQRSVWILGRANSRNITEGWWMWLHSCLCGTSSTGAWLAEGVEVATIAVAQDCKVDCSAGSLLCPEASTQNRCSLLWVPFTTSNYVQTTLLEDGRRVERSD